MGEIFSIDQIKGRSGGGWDRARARKDRIREDVQAHDLQKLSMGEDLKNRNALTLQGAQASSELKRQRMMESEHMNRQVAMDVADMDETRVLERGRMGRLRTGVDLDRGTAEINRRNLEEDQVNTLYRDIIKQLAGKGAVYEKGGVESAKKMAGDLSGRTDFIIKKFHERFGIKPGEAQPGGVVQPGGAQTSPATAATIVMPADTRGPGMRQQTSRTGGRQFLSSPGEGAHPFAYLGYGFGQGLRR